MYIHTLTSEEEKDESEDDEDFLFIVPDISGGS